jgi:glycosyltransferase involved in cell wall biosynthesis
MNILCINKFFYFRGGADKYFFELNKMLSGEHNLLYFSTKNRNNFKNIYSEYFVDGYTAETYYNFNILKKIKVAFKGLYSFEVKKKLEKLIKENDVSIANVHNIYNQLTPSIFDVLYKHKIPIVWFMNDYSYFCGSNYLYNDKTNKVCRLCIDKNHTYSIKYKCVKKSLLLSIYNCFSKSMQKHMKFIKKVDIIVVPTVSMKEVLVSLGIIEHKIRLLYNPYTQLNINQDEYLEKYIVFYGSLIKPKGIYTLINAMINLKSIKLKIYAKDEELYKNELLKYLSDNKIENVEINTSLRWGEKLIKNLLKSLAIVIPSEWNMPLEYSLLEAMDLGKCVIVSDIGGNKDLINDGENGLLFKAGSVKSLSDKIEFVIENKEMVRKIGNNARNTIGGIYAGNNQYLKLMKIYYDLYNK